jgi:hypothetical protein
MSQERSTEGCLDSLSSKNPDDSYSEEYVDQEIGEKGEQEI